MEESIDFLDFYPWIKDGVFQKVLSNYNNCNTDTIVVKNFTLKAALAKGENYSSQMIRAKLLYTINGEDNDCSLIIKTGVIDQNVRDMIEGGGLFLKEVVIYRDVLPEVNRLLTEKNFGTMLGPQCFASQLRPSYLIFEDLKRKGFRNVNRKVGLNFDHLDLCLSKLAKLHAATAVYGCTNPPALETYLKPLCTHDTPEFFPFFTKPVRLCAEVSKLWPGFEKISEKLFALERNIIDKVVGMFTRSKFNVITHGDLWVDYSTGFWGSPGIDIAYLLYSSSGENVNENDWTQLIRNYHKELINTLQILDYSGYIPSLDDINAEVIANSYYGVATSTFLIGLRFLENTADADIQSLLGESDFMKNLMGTDIYRKRMEFLLRFYDAKGLLD